jgi:hypothetical protein
MTYNKYRNRRTVIDGIPFDSQAEARRWQELKLLEAAGEIRYLQRQPRYELQPAFRRKDGTRVRAITYTADFVYIDSLGFHIVEDVKGKATEVFKLKRKLFMFRYPHIQLRITS